MSLLKAFEYIESIGGYEKLEEVEQELVDYTLEKLENTPDIQLIGGKDKNTRVGVFTFYVP